MAPTTKPQTAANDELRQLLLDPAVQKFRAEAMEVLPDSGPLRGLPSGPVVLELPDQVLTFRPPTFGEYRELLAYAETLMKEEVTVEEDSTVAWWRKAAAMLADGELPDEDHVPVWLANPVYPRQAQNHWAVRPTQAPGI